jgi:hypothetical protein
LFQFKLICKINFTMDDAGDKTKLSDDTDAANDDSAKGNNPMPSVPQVDESGVEEAQFEEPVASPNVVGEENVFSGDAPEGEPADIDEELAKVGLEPEKFGQED